jgi:hypothetical protein
LRSDTIYRRITDINGGLIDPTKHTHFEAGFYRIDRGIILLRSRVVDSAERVIFQSGNPFDDLAHLASNPDLKTKYLEWNLAQQLQDVIQAIQSEDITQEPACLGTPMCETTFEIQGPTIVEDAFKVTLSMSLGFIILDRYQWQDSSYISVGMLCKRETLLQFLNHLKNDFLNLSD